MQRGPAQKDGNGRTRKRRRSNERINANGKKKKRRGDVVNVRMRCGWEGGFPAATSGFPAGQARRLPHGKSSGLSCGGHLHAGDRYMGVKRARSQRAFT